MKVWSCWSKKRRDASISPCGYDKNRTDPACRGCADSPRTERDNEDDRRFRAVQESWYRRQPKGVIPIVVTAASAIAALTPTPKDDRIIGKLYKIIDLLALNVGQAKRRPGE